MSAATLGTKLLTNELTKKIRRTAGKGGRDPGVSALSRSIHRSAISVRSISTRPMAAADPAQVGIRRRVEDVRGMRVVEDECRQADGNEEAQQP